MFSVSLNIYNRFLLKWTLRTSVKEALACSACWDLVLWATSPLCFPSICAVCTSVSSVLRWRPGLRAPFCHWPHPNPALDFRVSPVTSLRLECSSGKFLCNWLFIQPFGTLLTKKRMNYVVVDYSLSLPPFLPSPPSLLPFFPLTLEVGFSPHKVIHSLSFPAIVFARRWLPGDFWQLAVRFWITENWKAS